MSKKMIDIDNVTFCYNSEQAHGKIQNINLHIETGEFVLLCGASGSGKTTITRLINGLIPHFYEGNLKGSIQIDGREINEQPLYETAKVVGSVFQNPKSQFFNVDTTSELAFGCENMGMSKENINQRILKTVNEMQLKPLMDRNIFQLSGGEKQKIACGCVSVSNPEIIVLDEPSSNLDEATMESLRQQLKLWKRQRKTIVVAEHRLAYLWDLVDHIVFMEQGQIKMEKQGLEKREISANEISALGLRTIEKKSIYNAQNRVMECRKKNKKRIMDSLVLTDFSFSYKNGREVFHIPKLMLPMNEITAIVGTNGIGKSTFLRCLCGLEKKCKGTISLQGKVLKQKERLKTVFMVMQDVNHQLFTESVMEELLISMGEENEEAAERILAELDLLEFKDRHPASLSGGQKQRVAVASAVASKRKIIVFDEPTSGLDYKHMIQIAKLLRRLQKSGVSVFVATHDAELIENCCTVVVSLEEQLDGKVSKNEKAIEYQTVI